MQPRVGAEEGFLHHVVDIGIANAEHLPHEVRDRHLVAGEQLRETVEAAARRPPGERGVVVPGRDPWRHVSLRSELLDLRPAFLLGIALALERASAAAFAAVLAAGGARPAVVA